MHKLVSCPKNGHITSWSEYTQVIPAFISKLRRPSILPPDITLVDLGTGLLNVFLSSTKPGSVDISSCAIYASQRSSAISTTTTWPLAENECMLVRDEFFFGILYFKGEEVTKAQALQLATVARTLSDPHPRYTLCKFGG